MTSMCQWVSNHQHQSPVCNLQTSQLGSSWPFPRDRHGDSVLKQQATLPLHWEFSSLHNYLHARYTKALIWDIHKSKHSCLNGLFVHIYMRVCVFMYCICIEYISSLLLILHCFANFTIHYYTYLPDLLFKSFSTSTFFVFFNFLDDSYAKISFSCSLSILVGDTNSPHQTAYIKLTTDTDKTEKRTSCLYI